MAEFEEIFEIIEEAEDGMSEEAEEAEEAMTPEEREEFNEEVAQATKDVETLKVDAQTFKDIMSSTLEVLKSFGIFVVKNVAIGAIFFGVNVALSKLVKLSTDKDKKESYQRKLAVVKAITSLIKSETDLSKAIKDWLEKHKDDTVVLDGIPLKMEAIFETHLKPIADAVEKAYAAAKPLMAKIEGKQSWNIPNADDINKLVDASDAYFKAFSDLRTFALQHTSKVPVLSSLLEILSQTSLDKINKELEAVKTMPFY